MISCLLPLKGRYEQTLALLPRLRATAGMDYELICVIDDDPGHPDIRYLADRVERTTERLGYWTALSIGSPYAKGNRFVFLANDLLPGKDWLKNADRAYRVFPDGQGAVGFWDGVWHGEHACHMLISKAMLLRWYGPALWPTCYDHCAGDNELWDRAQQENRLVVAPDAVLFHNHPRNGAAWDDVSRLGRKEQSRDAALWHQRKAAGWPPL